MRVLVTRPQQEAGPWVDDLCRAGFDAIALPLIAIEPSPDRASIALAWTRLAGCRSAMFVSGNAVRHFFDQRPEGAVWPDECRAWATGPGTRRALVGAGVPAGQIDAPAGDSPQFDSETLWKQVAKQIAPGDRVLIVRGRDSYGEGLGRDWLAEQLKTAGAAVDTVVSYVRAAPLLGVAQRDVARESTAGEPVWLFSSSQAIGHLQVLVPGQNWSRARCVATHPRIAQAARGAGFGVVCESRPSVDAVSAALESFR